MKHYFKHMYLFSIAVIVLILSSYFAIGHSKKVAMIEYVDFDSSMQPSLHTKVVDNQWGQQVYKIFKEQYEKNKDRQPTDVLHIPKIIHQIWLGGMFPEEYKQFQQSWIKHHPGWEYKLWTEEDLAQLVMQNQDSYDHAINYGEKSDIARYEILYQFGGLYVDTDYECFKSLESFHYCYDLYVGIQPLDTNVVQLGIGLIGSSPGNPLLKATLDCLKNNIAKSRQIISRTGPIYFTRVFCTYVPQLNNATIALPATYFYPRGYTQSIDDKLQWQKPESYAVHHWAGSWMKKEAFVR